MNGKQDDIDQQQLKRGPGDPSHPPRHAPGLSRRRHGLRIPCRQSRSSPAGGSLRRALKRHPMPRMSWQDQGGSRTENGRPGGAAIPNRCLSVAGSDRLFDPGLQLVLGGGAHLGGRHLPALEHHQGGDAAHAVARRRGGVLVDVDLHDLGLGAEARRDLLESRADHLAGAAPFGPEIDHDGRVGLQNVLFEGSVRHLVGGHGNLLEVVAGFAVG